MGHGRPLEVAESMRLLSVLAPGRVDLGLGRAPGGDQRTMSALGYDPRSAAERIRTLMRMLRDDRTASNSGDVVAVPDRTSPPDVWILGTSVDSARLAAELGLPYSFGSFIDPTNIEAALATYHQHFTPGVWLGAPYTMVATVIMCADTDNDARRIMECSERWFVESFLRGLNVRFPASGKPPDTTDQERIITAFRRETVIYGDAVSCRQQVEALQRRTQCNEVAVVTITEQHADRVRSYELLAES